MPENNNSKDKFWDISDMVPIKKTVSRAPLSDTSAVTVEIENDNTENGEAIPAGIKAQTKQPSKIIEYDIEGGLVRHIKLMPWPTGFSFYSKFHRDAQKYFDIKGRECNYEYFFSYMPQYEQLSSAQLNYYLYWRSLVRKNIYPPADSSYIFLYIYEIINLPDLIQPDEGASLLFDVWTAYRGKYRYLDKYIGEWLCDYCLIHRISIPVKAYNHFGSSLSGLSLPEFYIDNSFENISYSFIKSFSAYDFKKSRFYSEHSVEFDKHIPAAVVAAAKLLLSDAPSRLNISESHSLRDSFSGAIAYPEVKFKIEVTSYSLRRNREIHQMLTLAEKAAENELRAAFEIKSRFSVSGLDKDIISVISDYFDKFYPDRRRKKKKPSNDEEAEYMKYYAPRNVGEADVARAMRIERDAWETAVLLQDETVAHELPAGTPAGSEAVGSADGAQGARASADAEAARRSETVPQSGGEMSEFFTSLDQTLAFAVKSALDGQFVLFCRNHNIMEFDAQRRINELSDEYIGDMLIDSDFSVIEDYKDEAITVMTKLGIISTEDNE